MKLSSPLRAVTAMALSAVAVVGLTLSSPASASTDVPSTYNPPCSNGNVDCEGESSDDVPAGRWCSYDHDGNDATPPLVGETDKHGRCVCAVLPTTTTSTSTTVPETTTSTSTTSTSTTVPESTTTSTTVVTPTTETPTTVVPTTLVPTTEEAPTTLAPTTTDAPIGDFAARPAGARSLPRTGTNTGPMIAGGLALIVAGAALVIVTRRRQALRG
jgi:LPXTG-motif cell wall-anchored protein